MRLPREKQTPRQQAIHDAGMAMIRVLRKAPPAEDTERDVAVLLPRKGNDDA